MRLFFPALLGGGITRCNGSISFTNSNGNRDLQCMTPSRLHLQPTRHRSKQETNVIIEAVKGIDVFDLTQHPQKYFDEFESKAS